MYFNTLGPRYFNCILFNENVWIPIKISLEIVPKVRINNIPALVQMMAWYRPGDKLLSEPMVASLPTHICVTRPKWVKKYWNMLLFFCHFPTLRWSRKWNPSSHYSDVIVSAIASRLFAQPFVKIKGNIKAPCHWPLWGESNGDWWFPLTKVSNAENVSIWWRHNARKGLRGRRNKVGFAETTLSLRNIIILLWKREGIVSTDFMAISRNANAIYLLVQ